MKQNSGPTTGFAAHWLQLLPAAYKTYRRPPDTFSMTTDWELCFVETYACGGFTGAGKIVDLGCWFGATTIALARGLAQNTRATENRIIDSFDIFIWKDWMDQVAKSIKLPRSYRDGDCFYEDVKQLLEPCGSLVRLHKQDLTEYHAPDEPLEFLFIDAMKNWELANSIIQKFFPPLIAGTSYIVQQDFAYHNAIVATNHLIMWYLRENFEFVHHVPNSCSVVYFYKEAVDVSRLPSFGEEFFDLGMIDEAYDYSVQCVSPDMRPSVRAAKVGLLINRGYDERALSEAEALLSGENTLAELIINDLRDNLRSQRLKFGELTAPFNMLERLLSDHAGANAKPKR